MCGLIIKEAMNKMACSRNKKKPKTPKAILPLVCIWQQKANNTPHAYNHTAGAPA
jgi:hypothetical protein